MGLKDIDLTQFSKEELKTLGKLVKEQLVRLEVTERKEKLEDLHKQAAELGLGIKVHLLSENTRAKSKPKYMNPDTGETWAGRGGVPRWLQKFIAEGRSKDEFEIREDPVFFRETILNQEAIDRTQAFFEQNCDLSLGANK